MKLSLQLAQSTTDTDITSIGASSIVAKIGAQLGAVEDVISWSERYKGCVVAKVVTCAKHPNADKLSVCLIDDGGAVKNVERDEAGLVQVVCGAPNVRAGLLVAWLPPGAIVPASATDSEPFVLGTRELRGVNSNGMLASPSELGISDNHDGILEIDIDATPGAPFASLYRLDDTVIDLENKMFTHRPDCFGIIGVARELAGIQQKQYQSPDWYINEPQFADIEASKPLSIAVETDLVPRFSAIVVDAVKVGPSPIWMQADLTKLGIRPINSIVDITNWLMYMTGQPLHAYDYDKIIATTNDKATIKARQSKKGDSIPLINGKKIDLFDDSTVLICAGDTPIGIGGVMGGADTEVDENTKAIIIEAATFDMYSIRKTAMKYGLFTDAVTRFNKGQSPLQTTRVLARALQLVKELAGGEQASPLYDYADATVKPLPSVVIDTDFINKRLGTKLNGQDIAVLLNNVECHTEVDESRLTVMVPFWRRDLHIPEDIVEEVGRLYGFDSLPITLPMRTASPSERNKSIDFKYHLRNILTASGANEVLSYSFVHKKVLDAAQQNVEHAYSLSNALSPSLQYYRLSLAPSLLENVHKNIKAGYGAFALYEIGKVHSKQQIDQDGLPLESERLGFVFAADAKAEKAYQGEPYYQARVFLDQLAAKIGVELQYRIWNDVDDAYTHSDIAQPFLPARGAVLTLADGSPLGIIGEFSAKEVVANKLPAFCAGFELDIAALFAAARAVPNHYQPLSKYPKVTQDITFAVANEIPYSRVLDTLKDALQEHQTDTTQIEVSLLDSYQSEGVTSYTFRLLIGSHTHTMTIKDVNTLLDLIAATIENILRATRK